MIATVTLNPAVDYTACIAKPLEKGMVNRTASEHITAGGKGINVSYVLHELHEDTCIYGFSAGAVGAMLRAQVLSWGIRADWLELEGQNNRINLKIEESGVVTELNVTGVSVPAEQIANLAEKLRVYGENDIIVLAGSIPRGADSRLYADIMAVLHENGVRFAVDAEGEPLRAVLPYHPFVVKPNLPELCGLFGVEITRWQEAVSYGRKLQQMGAENVLLSLGGDGALLLTADGAVWRLDAPHSEVVNTVGAGDSMLAGFLAGAAKGWAMADCLRLGVAAGSATAFAPWLANAEQIEELLNKLPYPQLVEGETE